MSIWLSSVPSYLILYIIFDSILDYYSLKRKCKNQTAMASTSTTITVSRFFQPAYDYASSSEEELLSQVSDLDFSDEEDDLKTSDEEEDSDLEGEPKKEGSVPASRKVDSDNDSLFNGNDESDESDYDDDSDSKPYGPDWFKKAAFRKGGSSSTTGANKFLKSTKGSDSDSDNDSDEESGFQKKGVIKSAKQKTLDEFFKISRKIDAAELTNEWETLLEEFESSNKVLIKCQQQNFNGVPNIYIKILAQVEDAVNNCNDQVLENKNKSIIKAFNTVRQRIKKSIKEYATLLENFKATPELFENDELLAQESSLLPKLASTGKDEVDGTTKGYSSKTVEFFTKLNIVLESRGKKNTDINEQISTMEDLLHNVASNAYETIVAYLNLIPLRFESTNNMAYQPLDQWKVSYNDIVGFFSILEQNINEYIVTELTTKNDFIEEEPQVNPKTGIKEVLGSVFAFVERLDSEFIKSLLNIDYRSHEYLHRLRDEQSVYNLLLRTQLYLERTVPAESVKKSLTRVIIARLDHIYYKPCDLVLTMDNRAWSQVQKDSTSQTAYTAQIPSEPNNDAFKLIDGLVSILHDRESNCQLVLRKRATLYHVYFYALNSEYSKAVEMLEKSKLKSNINNAQGSLQILYNRVIVQLGFSAFKLCLFEDSQNILQVVANSSYLRDFMGQKPVPKNAEAGTTTLASANVQLVDGLKLEDLHLPYHKHIHLELIEAVFMTTSLMNDVPNIAAHAARCKTLTKVANTPKTIRKILESNERSSYQGPAETLRDFILYAAKSMQKGDWKNCVAYLQKTPVWKMFADEQADLMTQKVKEQSLKTYFFNTKRFYSKLSVEKLALIFDLEKSQIVDILSNNIKEHEVLATFEENGEFIVLEKGNELPKLEQLALKLEKERRFRNYRPSN